ncbi:carboxypeptidase-like regulatory domain-containing protein [Planctomycetota bacterium]
MANQKKLKTRQWIPVCGALLFVSLNALWVLAEADSHGPVHNDSSTMQSLHEATRQYYGMRQAVNPVPNLTEMPVIKGCVMDASGRGLTEVLVQTEGCSVPGMMFETGVQLPVVAVTDSEGCFTLQPGRVGDCTLVVGDGYHCSAWIQNIRPGRPDCTISLAPSPVVGGQVLIAEGHRRFPLAGIEVRAVLDESCGPVPLALASDRVTVTDTQGRFVFQGLGVQLVDGRHMDNSKALSPALIWQIRCGQVSEYVKVSPLDRKVDIKLIVAAKSYQCNGDRKIMHCVSVQ